MVSYTEHTFRQYYSRHLRRRVIVTTFVPQGATGPLPLLVLNDGQDMPAVGMHATLERLVGAGEIPPIAVAAAHADGNRLREYGTAGQPDYAGRGDWADRHSRFVVEDLLPHLRCRYPLTTDPTRCVFGGFSLGGLSAFDIVWHHPDCFRRVGVFSGALWWRRRSYEEQYQEADRIAHATVRGSEKREGLKFWFQAGTLDEESDRDGDGIIDAIGDTLHLMDELVSCGYARDADIRYLEVEGGRHEPHTWGEAMPDFLRWAFGHDAPNGEKLH